MPAGILRRWLFERINTCKTSVTGDDNRKGKASKKTGKSGQADHLGWPTPSPSAKRSGKCEFFWQDAIFGVILLLYIGQKWVKMFIIEAVPLPSPPKVSLTGFFTPSLKDLFSEHHILKIICAPCRMFCQQIILIGLIKSGHTALKKLVYCSFCFRRLGYILD